MNEPLFDAGMFLLGAGGGALWRYLHDRKLLHLYGDLVGQLSSSLRQQTKREHAVAEEAELLHEQADRARVGTLS